MIVRKFKTEGYMTKFKEEKTRELTDAISLPENEG
jgi:hypothetical protein